MIIKFMNMKIECGNMIALVGQNNSYKTAIVKKMSKKLKKVLYIENDDYKLLNNIDDIDYIIIDDLCLSLTKNESVNVIKKLKRINKLKHITIIVATHSLDYLDIFDYIYIINKKEILLEGNPKEILIQDSNLSKLGFSVPMMYDLSVKLNDYNILDTIITDMDLLVETIWK